MEFESVMLTGATGFIGNALLEKLIEKKINIFLLTRKPILNLPSSIQQIIIGDLESFASEDFVCPDLVNALKNVSHVIHCAGLAHHKKSNQGKISGYYSINRDATLKLAKIANKAGVKRFVYLSSIGVNGMNTANHLHPDLPDTFSEKDIPLPHNHYARSKYEAEQGLMEIASENKMSVTIIRPPLVYSLKAPGNFGALVKYVQSGLPLPFARVNNRRSLIAIENLVDFILHASQHPAAINELYLVADSEAVSTTEIVKEIREVLGVDNILIRTPDCLLKLIAVTFAKHSLVDSLFGSLLINTDKAKKDLNWRPVVTMHEQFFGKVT